MPPLSDWCFQGTLQQCMYTGIAMLIHSLRGGQNPALPLQRKSRERTVFPRFLRPQATARIGFFPMRQSSITHYTCTTGGVPLQGACERCRTALFARFFRSRGRRQDGPAPSEGCNPYILMRLQPSFFRCGGMLSGRTQYHASPRLTERMPSFFLAPSTVRLLIPLPP